MFREPGTPGDVFHWINEQFSTEELERLTIHNPSDLSRRMPAADSVRRVFSFDGEEYVHPRVVKELLGWLSDSTATIMGVSRSSNATTGREASECSTQWRCSALNMIGRWRRPGASWKRIADRC